MRLARKSGELKAKKETALSFAKMGLSVEQIAEGLKENVKVIEEWISEGVTVSQMIWDRFFMITGRKMPIFLNIINFYGGKTDCPIV